MVTSIDGKVTGDFLFQPECVEATDVYYRLNRELKSNGFICGRVTMEQSFTGGFYPDLNKYEGVNYEKNDFVPNSLSGFYAVAFDTKGRLGWKSNKIIDPDGDPGYDGAQIIEVLSELADERYLAYLESLEIPYVFAGSEAIDVNCALRKLKELFCCETLLLEGGSIINGAFERADAIDELSLVVAPIIADDVCKPLFISSNARNFSPEKAEKEGEVLVLRYKKR